MSFGELPVDELDEPGLGLVALRLPGLPGGAGLDPPGDEGCLNIRLEIINHMPYKTDWSPGRLASKETSGNISNAKSRNIYLRRWRSRQRHWTGSLRRRT